MALPEDFSNHLWRKSTNINKHFLEKRKECFPTHLMNQDSLDVKIWRRAVYECKFRCKNSKKYTSSSKVYIIIYKKDNASWQNSLSQKWELDLTLGKKINVIQHTVPEKKEKKKKSHDHLDRQRSNIWWD